MKTRLELYIRRVEDPKEINKVCPLAFELHNRRKEALHDIFDNQTYFRVETWGDTDDEKQAHEAVTIIVTAIVTSIAKEVFTKVVEKIGEKLVEKALDESASELVKWVVSKLIRKQKKEKIEYANIVINGETVIEVNHQANAPINIRIDIKTPATTTYKINKE